MARPQAVPPASPSNVVDELPLNFAQVALGVELDVPTLYGPAKLKVPAGTQAGKVIRLKGKGMPLVNRPSTFGDEWVEIKVVTPEKLSKRQKQLLEELGKSFGTPPKRPAKHRAKTIFRYSIPAGRRIRLG